MLKPGLILISVLSLVSCMTLTKLCNFPNTSYSNKHGCCFQLYVKIHSENKGIVADLKGQDVFYFGEILPPEDGVERATFTGDLLLTSELTQYSDETEIGEIIITADNKVYQHKQ